MNTLIVNLSLRSIRVIIFNDKGEKLHEDWLPVGTSISEEFVEQDPNEWWKLLQELLKNTLAMKQFTSSIRYISVTSSASCLVVLDNQGKVLRKSIMVSDKRAEKESEELKEKFSQVLSKADYGKFEPSFMLPKILWIKNNEPEIFKKAQMYISSNDYLIYKLTGSFITDDLNAEKFYFNPKSKTYPKEILRYIGISEENLAKVTDPGTALTQVKEDIKKELKLSGSVEVAVSTYDAICSLIGSSTYKEGELNNVCGTCSSYRFFTKDNQLSKKHNLILQSLSGEEINIIGGSNNLEGGLLEWAKECFYGDSYLKDDNFLYGLMQQEATESELGANGILFLPYLLGERMPFVDNDVRGIFFGIERFHTRKDIVRSIFEAISFQAKLMLEEFEKSGYEISAINISGGVAKIPLATQIRADVLGLPINVLSEIETTALGAFILTLKARGKIKSIREASGVIHIEKTYVPNMHNHNCYASLFILYKQLYNDHKEIFKKRKDILTGILHYRKKVVENL